MMAEFDQARLQRIEERLKSLDERVSVLSVTEGAAVKQKISETFAGNPRNAIIYRGVQRGMSQSQIASALKERRLTGALQQRVSDTLAELVEAGFVRRAPKGAFVTRDEDGWNDFGLERVLKKTLRDQKVADLG